MVESCFSFVTEKDVEIVRENTGCPKKPQKLLKIIYC